VLACLLLIDVPATRADGLGQEGCQIVAAPLYQGDIALSCTCGPPSEPYLGGENGCSAKGILVIYYACNILYDCEAPGEFCLPDPEQTTLHTVMVIPKCKSVYGNDCDTDVDCGYWGDTEVARQQIPLCFCD
jgi:hypothetical protein